MENFKLTSQPREDAGKGVARKFRADGRIPAVLYGHKETPVSLTIDESDMRAILQAHPDSAIVDLRVGKSGKINALVREVQRHPASGKLLHIDFQRISLDEKVRVDIPVEAMGVPVGVKDQGGMLEHGTRSVTVLCLPREIPDAIVLDVSGLNVGDTIKIKDIQASYEMIEIMDDVDSPLATVVPPRVEAEPTEEEGVEEAATTEPEVVGKDAEESKDEGSESKD